MESDIINKFHSDTKYINVISGKGGTGKTLICTTLAELLGNQNISVLIIDMDIFVRGLTALLYFNRGEIIQLSDEHELTISDIFHLETENVKIQSNISGKYPLAIHKYRSFDILPSVSRIDQEFNFEKQLIFDIKHNERCLHRIIELIPKDKYHYVIFDCRSGYDSLISVIHTFSSATICVQEEDDISEVTANNLIRQLTADSYRKTIFKIVNKTRNIKTFEDLANKQKKGLTFLGYIPFDIDVMNSFGEDTFWDDISRSLYKASVSESWNSLCDKLGINDYLRYKRYSPLISTHIEKRLNFISLPDRLIAVMGLFLSLLGLFYVLIGDSMRYYFKDRIDVLVSLFITFFGFFLFTYSILRKRNN
jgi:septum site-determining protein MinD